MNNQFYSGHVHLQQGIGSSQVAHIQTTFKPRCCLNFQSMRTQEESTDIVHNMFGQIKIKIPWYSSRHTLISRKKMASQTKNDEWPVWI
jgi:hypothetical protein